MTAQITAVIASFALNCLGWPGAGFRTGYRVLSPPALLPVMLLTFWLRPVSAATLSSTTAWLLTSTPDNHG